MFKRLLALVIPFVLLFSGVAAASEKKEGKATEKDAGQYVDLLPVALPVVVDGRLVNYIFVNVRINLTSRANAANLRAKEPFFRDALVRSGHRAPFVVASDLEKIDGAKVAASLARDAAALVGPGQIAGVVITSQAPQRRVPRPRPAPKV